MRASRAGDAASRWIIRWAASASSNQNRNSPGSILEYVPAVSGTRAPLVVVLDALVGVPSHRALARAFFVAGLL